MIECIDNRLDIALEKLKAAQFDRKFLALDGNAARICLIARFDVQNVSGGNVIGFHLAVFEHRDDFAVFRRLFLFGAEQEIRSKKDNDNQDDIKQNGFSVIFHHQMSLLFKMVNTKLMRRLLCSNAGLDIDADPTELPRRTQNVRVCVAHGNTRHK